MFEIAWRGIAHASVNRSLLRVVTRACPDAHVVFHADAGQIEEVMAIEPDQLATVVTKIINLPENFRHRPHVMSYRRLFAEAAIFAEAMRPYRGERCLILLGSSTCTAITAARLSMARFLSRAN
jgi:hypothetical protein